MKNDQVTDVINTLKPAVDDLADAAFERRPAPSVLRAHAMTAHHTHVRAPSRRRPVWLAGAASVAAAAVATVAVYSMGTGTSRPATQTRLTAATTFLDKAADAAANRPNPRPGPHQWLYISSTTVGTGWPLRHDAQWLRADGRKLAFFQDGKLILKNTTPGYSVLASYDMLAKLPTDPHALLAEIAKLPSTGPGVGDGRLVQPILGAPSVTPFLRAGSRGSSESLNRSSSEFLTLAYLIWNSPVGAPPATRAALYRALSEIPGITIDPNARTLTGRHVVSLSGLLFDPKTYELVGSRSVANADLTTDCDVHNVCHTVRPGTVTSEDLKTVRHVAAPGDR
ncbi:CU044_5270 family protein [Spirillospora sp. NPDC052269]